MNDKNLAEEKTPEQLAEELWDKYSYLIDDDLDSLQEVAGKSVIKNREDFIKAIQDFHKAALNQVPEVREGEITVNDFEREIDKCFGYDDKAEYPTFDTEQAAQACYALAQKMAGKNQGADEALAIGFAEWTCKNGWVIYSESNNGIHNWSEFNNDSKPRVYKTTKELLDDYLNQNHPQQKP